MDDWGDVFHDQGLAEWREWFGSDSVPSGEWEQVLYKGSLAQLDSLILARQGRGKPPRDWAGYALLRARGDRLDKALWYAGFAIRVEPWSRRGADAWGDWRERPGVVRIPAEKLWKAGLAQAAKETDPFLRQRWFFQLAKLRFYQLGDADRFVDSVASALAGPSANLRWRARMYRAGALPDPVERDLECARVAWAWPELSAMAARDFRVPEGAEWKELLRRARSRDDKLAVWFAMGLKADGFEAMGRMLAIDSAAPRVDLLASRLLERARITGEADTLERVAARLARSQAVARPAFWALLSGHLAGLAGDPAALPRLERALELSGDDTLVRAQARRSRVLARLALAKGPSPELEDFVRTELSDLDSLRGWSLGGFDPLVSRRLAAVWRARPEVALCLSRSWSGSSDTLARVLAFVRRDGTPFEEFAKRRSGFTETDVRRELGAALLAEGKLAEAAAELARAPDDPALGVDPFRETVKDDHDRDHAETADAPWTRASFAAELVRLQKVASGHGPEAGEAALRLGLGLRAMTWYGNARSVFEGTAREPGTTGVKLASRALETAARELKAPERIAFALWNLAKCQRDSAEAENAEQIRPDGAYARLRRESADTGFWKRALRECGWLADWRNGGPRTY